jgi:AcrR family transcriptional regulator
VSRKKPTGVTRQHVLDTAWELISKQGAEVSMQDIANQAGVSRQSVYLHFKTRGGLLLALVKHADDRFNIYEDYLETMQINDPRKRLGTWLHVWFSFVVKIRPVATDLIRLRKTDPDAESAWTDRMTDLREWEHKLIISLADNNALHENWTIDDASDYLWASSSMQIFDILAGDRSWSETKTANILRQSICNTLLA